MAPSSQPLGPPQIPARFSWRGDACVPTRVIQGARSGLQRAKVVIMETSTPEQSWIRKLAVRMPFGKVVVAIANKHSRQIWVMPAHEVDYDPNASRQHPMHRNQQAA